MATFREENLALQHLVRELVLIRDHNLQFKEGNSQKHLLLFAESALANIVLEHFVRLVVGNQAPPDATLFTLLEIAVSKKLLMLPWDSQADGIRKLCNVRNTTLHGNYAQAAKDAGCASVLEFFRTQATSETENVFRVVDYLMKQIDPETGLPRFPPNSQ
jgi:hypothetical protein